MSARPRTLMLDRLPLPAGLRLGLCCQFAEVPIKFRTTTAAAMVRQERAVQLERLADLCRSNAQALLATLDYCATNGIVAFRVSSQILPVKTHPVVGYAIDELPGSAGIVEQFRACGRFAHEHDLRLSFHPDQFVVLNSPNPATVAASLAEMDYQAEVAEWLGADSLNLHGGGAYGDKDTALARLRQVVDGLPAPIRTRLTFENDDKTFTVSDLLPVCHDLQVPLVFDVHHHRCLPDGLSIGEATERARATWTREPHFHLSSPLEGWDGPRPERHHDFIAPADFPREWLGWPLTVDIEAKAKEIAIARLSQDLGQRKES